MGAGALKIEIELPRELLAALNIAETDLGRRAQEWVILELLQEGEISAGKAAEILGMTKSRFLDLLAEKGLPYLDASARELHRELAAAEAAAKRPRD
jgi:predicted HTH domain antitoxin